MMRKETIGNATLYLADCLEVLPAIEPVGCVVTDPAYLLEAGGNTTKEMGGKFAKDAYDNTGSIVETPLMWEDFMGPIYDAMSEGHAYFMANNRNVSACQVAGEAAGFRFHNLLVWDKGTATPNRWYMKNCEFTLFMFKGKARYIKDCGAKQLLRAPNVLNALHPTEKPVSLMEHYIMNSSVPGQTVLDPFMGGGTTGVACARLGRAFVGIEIDPKHFDLACKRIDAACVQHDMFASA